MPCIVTVNGSGAVLAVGRLDVAGWMCRMLFYVHSLTYTLSSTLS